MQKGKKEELACKIGSVINMKKIEGNALSQIERRVYSKAEGRESKRDRTKKKRQESRDP